MLSSLLVGVVCCFWDADICDAGMSMRAGELFRPGNGTTGQMKTSFHLERDIRTFSEKNATGICALAANWRCIPSRLVRFPCAER
ncbi:hypothetical protein ABID16_001119 [Rhizobium aquaticum]|uniref:Secreted protein n=1 Tax=Rhizobium aquaticum TaxID=1549636 RepID=A0ABV2IYV3_9HYPH